MKLIPESPYFPLLKSLKEEYQKRQTEIILSAIKTGFPLTEEEIRELEI